MDFITIIGLVAAILTTVSFLPQAIKIIKTRKTKDISLMMYMILCLGFMLWLIYGILIKNIPVIFANVISLSLGTIILIFKIKYK